MNFQQMRLLMEHSGLRERTEWAVLLVLIFHADDQSGEAWPGRELIALEARMTSRCVEVTLGKLVERGFLSVVKPGGGFKRTTVYKVHVEKGRVLGEPDSANATAERAKATAKRTTNGEAETAKRTRSYKVEGIKKEDGRLNVEEEERARGSTNAGGLALGSAVENRASVSPSPSLLALAICEVCGRNPQCLSPAQFQGVQSSLDFLRQNEPGGSAESLAAEVRRRFDPEVWPMPSPPQTGQIGTEWHRQGMILKKRETNHADRMETETGGGRSAGPLSSRQRTAADRRRLLREQGILP